MRRQHLLFRLLISAFGLSVLGSGCTQHRLAMDYEINIDREFGVEHTKETQVFHSGEKFRLRVTTHDDGYLYILNRGTSDVFHVLYPRPEISDGSAFVPGWEHVAVPTHGAFQFDMRPGVEDVIICFSRKTVPKLDRIVHGEVDDPDDIAAALHTLDVASKRDGSFMKTHYAGHTQVVLCSPLEGAVLVNTIRLTHL